MAGPEKTPAQKEAEKAALEQARLKAAQEAQEQQERVEMAQELLKSKKE